MKRLVLILIAIACLLAAGPALVRWTQPSGARGVAYWEVRGYGALKGEERRWFLRLTRKHGVYSAVYADGEAHFWRDGQRCRFR